MQLRLQPGLVQSGSGSLLEVDNGLFPAILLGLQSLGLIDVRTQWASGGRYLLPILKMTKRQGFCLPPRYCKFSLIFLRQVLTVAQDAYIHCEKAIFDGIGILA